MTLSFRSDQAAADEAQEEQFIQKGSYYASTSKCKGHFQHEKPDFEGMDMNNQPMAIRHVFKVMDTLQPCSKLNSSSH
jgi:hypothetical protein